MIKDILIIDDEVGIRELLQEILKSNSFQPRHAANGQEARVEILTVSYTHLRAHET